MVRLSGLLLWGYMACAVAASTAETTLDNGLKVIVREDHRSPVVVVQVSYRAGSIDEKDGKTGLAHMLEHMMFKGAAKVPAGEFSRIVNKFGGEDNAYTTADFTSYYQIYAADRLPLALELEADRMGGLRWDDKEFQQEQRVVMEERRWRTEDSPSGMALERFSAVANMASPYRRPTIGWMQDIEGLRMSDAQDWYQRWYAPNNAVLVVAGDVMPEQVFTQVQQYFGSISRRSVPDAVVPHEPSPPGERRLTLHLPGKVPALYLGFNVPGMHTAKDLQEVYALRMLAGVLDEGESARLQAKIVRGRQIAAAVGSDYGGVSRGDALFVLTGVPATGHGLDELETSLKEEIHAVQENPPSADEVARVQAQLTASEVYKNDSVAAMAATISQFEAVGLSWKDVDAFAERLKAVTPEQIQAVARKYLTQDRMTITRVEPQS